MNRLCDSSDTKLLFRYIQATHHRSQVLQTPRGLLKMQSKLNSFIKVAAPNPIQIKRVSDINADWAKSQSQAMQAHYNDLLGTAKTTIKDRTFTQESFNQAWNGALKWAKQSLGDKLAQNTIDTCRGVCRHSAMLGAPQNHQQPQPSTSASTAPPITPSIPTNEEWTVVTRKQRWPIHQQNLTAVAGAGDALSNFFKFSFWFNGKRHHSVEQAYQMSKAHWMGNLKAFHQIAATTTAPEAKRASDHWFKSDHFKRAQGNNVYIRKRLEEWDRQRSTRVMHLLREKAKQCKPFMQALRNSNTSAIIHNVTDRFWGTGSREVRQTNATNTFGHLLEQVRFETLGLRTERGPAPRASPAEQKGRKAPPPECRKQTYASVTLAGPKEARAASKETQGSRKAPTRQPTPVVEKGQTNGKGGRKDPRVQLQPQILVPTKETTTRDNQTTISVSPPKPQRKWNSKDRRSYKRARQAASQEGSPTGPRSPAQETKRARHLSGSECDIGTVPTRRPSTGPDVVSLSVGVHHSSLNSLEYPSLDEAERTMTGMPTGSPKSLAGTSPMTIPSGIKVPLQESGSTVAQGESPAKPTSPARPNLGEAPLSPLSTSLPPILLPPTVEPLSSSLWNPVPSISKSPHISTSQPARPITEFFGPKTTKVLKFTTLKSNQSGETFVRSQVSRFEHGNNKKAWQLPAINKTVLIIGDSNLSSVRQIRQAAATSCQIISYPGAKYKELYDILRKVTEPQTQVKHLILSIGINNRAQNALSTANKDIRSLIFQAMEKFPKAKVYYPEIGNHLPNLKEMSNLRDFHKTWSSYPSITILPSITPIRTTAPDGIHWTWDTAKLLVDSWLDHLNLN